MRIPPLSLILSFVLCASTTLVARAGQVVFSEVMYHPVGTKPEFIEIWNLTKTPLDMASWRLTRGVDFTFPDFTPAAAQAHFLRPFERILVSSQDPAATRAAHPEIPAGVRIFGPWVGILQNSGERVTLEDKNGVIVCSLEYLDGGHWPVAADGTGHSLVLINENRTFDDWRNWRWSNANGGSPGLPEAPAAETVSLSEVHFGPTGAVDWIELRNGSASVKVVDGLFVSSRRDLSDKVPIAGSIPAFGFSSYDVAFATTNGGEIDLYVADGSNNVVAAGHFQRLPGAESLQEFPAGSGEWFRATVATRDSANNPDRRTEIVIHEIMYDPPSNQRDGEFIELFNRGVAAVDLSGWRIEEAVDFTFPAGTTIAPGGYLVVAANATVLNGSYPGLNALGDWEGQLSNNGEMIRLLDEFGSPADIVDYRAGGDWPDLANGNGSSLELVHPDADNSVGGAWKDSDESTKSSFQQFAITGVHGPPPASGDNELRLWVVGDSHLVLKNIVLRPSAGGANLMTNAEVVTLANENVSGWQCRGTHWASFSNAEGVHLVADGHGDNKANHAEKTTTAMGSNVSYTLEFEARWVWGKPRLVAQTWDTAWGGTLLLPIPLNLGTPGAANSRAVPAPPPQIATAVHSPAIPQPNQLVTVTARIVSATPLSSVEVKHRLDTASAPNPDAFAATAMNDAGTAGDAVAGDGIFTAQIGNYPNNKQVAQFYVRATAANGQTADYPKGGAGAPGLWIVDSQIIPTDMRRMRIVISAYWLNALNQSSGTGGNTANYNFKYPLLSNRYMPCTFISNENEVYYGCTVRKTGSPFTRQQQLDASLVRGRVSIPTDRGFRGQEKLYWDNDAGTSLRHNRIVRYWLYLLGVPVNENEFVRVMRNGDTPTIRETNEVFDKRMLDRIVPDGSQGHFYEMDDTFFIADDGATRLANINGSWAYKNTANPVAYHNSFIPKSREPEYDYSGFVEWTRQLQVRGSGLTAEELDRMADTQAMAAYAAVRGYVSDWDNITLDRGKNGYFFQRPDGKFMLLHWDSDLAFRSGDYGDLLIGTLQNVAVYFNHPYVKHYLHYYVTEMMSKYTLNSPRINAWISAENAALPTNPVDGVYGTWFANRNPNLNGILGASLTTTFALTSPPPTTADNTVELRGTAPATAFRIEVAGHPEAVAVWTGPVTFTVGGIQLQTGANTLTLRMFDRLGNQVGGDVNHIITKSGDAPPVLAISSIPPSMNVGLGDTITLDAAASHDPEGTPLTFAWSFSPRVGANASNPSVSSATAVFSVPGVYTFTLGATDGAGSTAATAREATAYNRSDFYSFADPLLKPALRVQNAEQRDNYSPGSWYSLNDDPNRLLLQVYDDAARPLANPAFTHPAITRELPSSTDWVLQTDVEPVSKQFGSFTTGLLVETSEGGVPVRYAFGLFGGLEVVNGVTRFNPSVTVQRAVGEGPYTMPAKVPSTGESATLRARRIGDELRFERRVNDVWITILVQPLSEGTVAGRGGIFVATETAEAVRVSFDYLLVVDPSKSASLVDNLRISEIMYNPSGTGVEFIELTNTGATPLNLQGVYFEDGQPFDRFTFGEITLQPGAFVVVTNTMSGFGKLYGTGIAVAGEYDGALSNEGERIVLKDPDGNIIQDFSYDDVAPWPAAANGGGRSLEILLTRGNYSSAANWRPGVERNGSPGVLGRGFDADADSQPDRVEVRLGTDPLDANSSFKVTEIVINEFGEITLSWPSLPGLAYLVEQCSDPQTASWQLLGTVLGSGVVTTFTDSTAPRVPRRFYRVRVNL